MNLEPFDPKSTVTLTLSYSPLVLGHSLVSGLDATGSASAVFDFTEPTDTGRASGTRIHSLDTALVAKPSIRHISTSSQWADYPIPTGLLDWPAFLRYLNARATMGVEIINLENSAAAQYVRSININGCTGTLMLAHHPTQPELNLTIQGDAVVHASEITARVRRICDLDIDLAHVHQVLGMDNSLRPLLTASPGIRVPGAWSAFELLVRTIVGQQVTVRAATTIIGRIASRLGRRVIVGNESTPPLLFPTPQAIADSDLSGIGMPGKRIETLQSVARAIADQAIPDIEQIGNNDAIKAALLNIPGIGPWTVEYFALRALRDTDAWPESDLVLKRATNQLCDSTSPAANRKYAAQWSPYRGYVAMHFWHRAAQMASESQLSRVQKSKL